MILIVLLDICSQLKRVHGHHLLVHARVRLEGDAGERLRSRCQRSRKCGTLPGLKHGQEMASIFAIELVLFIFFLLMLDDSSEMTRSRLTSVLLAGQFVMGEVICVDIVRHRGLRLLLVLSE